MSLDFAYLNRRKAIVENNSHLCRPDIDAFEGVMMREERMLGYFVGDYSIGD